MCMQTNLLGYRTNTYIHLHIQSPPKDLHFNYTCECSDGYEGRHCEIDIDDCVSVMCGGHGLCVDGVGTFTCACEEGYTGELCEDVIINTGGEYTVGLCGYMYVYISVILKGCNIGHSGTINYCMAIA